MDAESEAHTQRAEAGRAEANVKREGPGNPEPARVQRIYGINRGQAAASLGCGGISSRVPGAVDTRGSRRRFQA